MLPQSETPSKAAITPDDLEVLEKFLDAWCEENGVDKSDDAAKDVASALIALYQEDPKYRSRIQLESSDALPVSREIEILLRKIT
ncbi:hypothetical protein J2X76_006010 [Neorhizobium sp. 2083]|uniref:hypothetical protein n=1 Tax=Neorhizobium sp. 2083 TaxID=2817762 RepID=UPI002856EB14|nr:hypothetical protein [Neorhizobium sp. 2083]MDR6820810.1 hypothetical protein [Neorhizobium sp. 2083]